MVKYLMLKKHVGGNARGITIKGIIYRHFLKNNITEVSDEQYDKLKEIGKLICFEELSQENYDKYIKKTETSGKKELTDMKAKQDLVNQREQGLLETKIVKDSLPGDVTKDKPGEEEEKKSVGDDRIFTQKEAYDLTTDEQITLLKKRGLKTEDIKQGEENEKFRVPQILETNPEVIE